MIRGIPFMVRAPPRRRGIVPRILLSVKGGPMGARGACAILSAIAEAERSFGLHPKGERSSRCETEAMFGSR